MYAIIAAILIILICILFGPLKVKIDLHTNKLNATFFLFNIPVFKLKRSQKEDSESSSKKSADFTKETEKITVKLKRFTDTFGITVKLLRKFVGIKDLNLNIIVGTGDAALTAISVGALWAVVYRVLGIVGSICYIDEQSVEITPDYTETVFSLNGDCIIKSRIAYIIFIVITILMKIKSRKGKEE